MRTTVTVQDELRNSIKSDSQPYVKKFMTVAVFRTQMLINVNFKESVKDCVKGL